MPSLLAPNEILSLTTQAAQRLLESGNGDCALLYLALLANGGDGEKARHTLRWDAKRLDGAFQNLVSLDLLRADQVPPPLGQPEQKLDQPPEYTRSDLNTALEQEGDFRALCDAVEEKLGRKLGAADLNALYTIYDYIALPPDVILMLTQWCVSETERKYGKGRRPRMSTVKKEAFRWKREGLETSELAEDFLRRQQALSGRERELLPLLDIRGRPAVAKEREYLSAWVDMGFEDDAIRLAYEKTLFQKQRLSWPYMNSILKRWHQSGWHTVAQVEAEDKPPQRVEKTQAQPPKHQPDFQPTAQRIQENDDWLDEFLKDQQQK